MIMIMTESIYISDSKNECSKTQVTKACIDGAEQVNIIFAHNITFIKFRYTYEYDIFYLENIWFDLIWSQEIKGNYYTLLIIIPYKNLFVWEDIIYWFDWYAECWPWLVNYNAAAQMTLADFILYRWCTEKAIIL